MSAAPPPPWQGRTTPLERTPDGQEIVQTRFGPCLRRPDRLLEPYISPEELAARINRRPRRPLKAVTDFNVWNC